MRNKIKDLLKNDVQDQVNELYETKGVIKDIDKKSRDIEDKLQELVTMDTKTSNILDKVKALFEELERLL